jgi:hypothetical protein
MVGIMAVAPAPLSELSLLTAAATATATAAAEGLSSIYTSVHCDGSTTAWQASPEATVSSGSSEGIAAIEDTITESVPEQVIITQDSSRYCIPKSPLLPRCICNRAQDPHVTGYVNITGCTCARYLSADITCLYTNLSVLCCVYIHCNRMLDEPLATGVTATAAKVSTEQPPQGWNSAWSDICKNMDKAWKQVTNDQTLVKRTSSGIRVLPTGNNTKCGWHYITVPAVDGRYYYYDNVTTGTTL